MRKECAHHYGARIHHGIVRSILGIEDRGIEGQATWLLADILVEVVAIALGDLVVIMQKCICHYLAKGLHGEHLIAVTNLCELSIC